MSLRQHILRAVFRRLGPRIRRQVSGVCTALSLAFALGALLVLASEHSRVRMAADGAFAAYWLAMALFWARRWRNASGSTR